MSGDNDRPPGWRFIESCLSCVNLDTKTFTPSHRYFGCKLHKGCLINGRAICDEYENAELKEEQD